MLGQEHHKSKTMSYSLLPLWHLVQTWHKGWTEINGNEWCFPCLQQQIFSRFQQSFGVNRVQILGQRDSGQRFPPKASFSTLLSLPPPPLQGHSHWNWTILCAQRNSKLSSCWPEQRNVLAQYLPPSKLSSKLNPARSPNQKWWFKLLLSHQCTTFWGTHFSSTLIGLQISKYSFWTDWKCF